MLVWFRFLLIRFGPLSLITTLLVSCRPEVDDTHTRDGFYFQVSCWYDWSFVQGSLFWFSHERSHQWSGTKCSITGNYWHSKAAFCDWSLFCFFFFLLYLRRWVKCSLKVFDFQMFTVRVLWWVGVAGGAASGKTSVCDMIIQQLHDQRVVLVNQVLNICCIPLIYTFHRCNVFRMYKENSPSNLGSWKQK